MEKKFDDIEIKLIEMKKLYEDTIISGGRKGVTSLIRSQKLINILHNYIKEQLVSYGVNPSKIYPKIDETKPELKMAGFLKEKSQDISIIAGEFKQEIITGGVLIGKKDKIGLKNLSKSLSINVRSQLSSLGKNFDTLYERTFAEALNLHLRIPELVMGEVYLLPLVAYDPKKMKENEIDWDEKAPIKYIPAFREINNRSSTEIDDYKYERVCLLIVDFREEQPVIIESSKQLHEMGWIDEKDIEKFSLKGLGIKDFVKDLLNSYEERHGDISPLNS
ncbi:MAG: restriction endonuclease [Candidatus Peregrinibacteria bacterium]|nr:restriction endonuclease [Candidatus Peregrinibacteria bacterium]